MQSTDSSSTRRLRRWRVATAAARRYARAVFDLAQEEGRVEEWRERLAVLRDGFTDETVAAVLTNPTIPLSTRMDLISVPSSALGEESINLAKLLVESNRVREMSAIVDEYEALADAARSEGHTS